MGSTSSGGPLKIGLVFDDSLDKPDGVQQYILSLGTWLKQQGHTVHYLVGQTKRTDIDHVHSLSRNVGVTFNGNQLSIPLPTPRRRLKQVLDQERFDVLHVQMPYSPWLAQRIILTAAPQTAIFGTFHIVAFSPIVKLATRALALWTKSSLARFTTIVSVSAAAAQYVKATYQIDTAVVPNVFDYPRFANAQPVSGRRPGVQRILFLGRLVERKGCQYLLEAVRALKEDGYSEFEVMVCGKGPLLARLQQFATTHSLPVHFVGFVSEAEKPAYYASADIAVFPSTGGESFGIVLVEAMANGRTAVLAAANSGYSSVMTEKPALLFPPKNVGALTQKLKHLLDNPEERHRAAVWGARYCQRFDVDVVGRQLVADYRRSIKETANLL